MNFQQLRYVRAAVRNELNLTRAANELFTSQSGVSKQIKELEAQLGIDIFVRRGKRLTGLTPAGNSAVVVIDRLLQEAENLKRLSQQFVESDKGRLVIATTHNQANYVLPRVLQQFGREFPDVQIELRQGSPAYVVDALIAGDADIGIATEAVDDHPELLAYPCFTWTHVAIVAPGHPLATAVAPGIGDIARYPVITYNPDFTGRPLVNEAFAAAGLEPDIRLTAMDADVIKTYARLGMGVGIVAEMAVQDALHGECGDGLVVVPGSRGFFRPSSTKIAVHQGALLRNYAYRLMLTLAPHLDLKALQGRSGGCAGVAPAGLRAFSDRTDLHLGAHKRRTGVDS